VLACDRKEDVFSGTNIPQYLAFSFALPRDILSSCRQDVAAGRPNMCSLLGLAFGTKKFGFRTCRLHGDTELSP
jgi:hypothetical protein